MYLAVIYSLILTAIVVMAVKHFQPVDDQDGQTPEATRKASKTLFATGFFLFIVLLIAFHLMGIGESPMGSTRSGGGGGGGGSSKHDYESAMLEKINQTVHTGFAPF